MNHARAIISQHGQFNTCRRSVVCECLAAWEDTIGAGIRVGWLARDLSHGEQQGNLHYDPQISHVCLNAPLAKPILVKSQCRYRFDGSSFSRSSWSDSQPPFTSM